jgi:hypothetical protein
MTLPIGITHTEGWGMAFLVWEYASHKGGQKGWTTFIWHNGKI